MTVATTYARELDITRLVLRSYNLAGLMAPEQGTSGPTWDRRASLAKDFLQAILDELGACGVFARSIRMETLTLTAGTFTYDLPDEDIDVLGDGAYISASETDITKASSETPVLQKDRETWQRLGAKSGSSRPTIFWVNRVATPIQVVVWPIPDEAGTIRFQSQRLSADVTSGTATVDLQRFWTEYLVWQLAHHLAVSANKLEHGGYCAQQAMMYKTRAQGAANQNTPSFVRLDHRTGWN